MSGRDPRRADVGALSAAREAWIAADWAALASLAVPAPDAADARATLVLAAGGALHSADLDAARRLGAEALACGADPRLLGMAWLASVEDDLVMAGASMADERQARAAGWREAVLQRAMATDVDAPPTQLSKARDEALRLRNEVFRQRELIEKLRAGAHNAMRQLSREGDQALINRVIDARLTYLSQAKMHSLARTCRALEEQHIAGRFIEAGCALGGSAILIASLKNATRPFSVYDVFGMIPPPSESDPPEVHERYRTIIEGRSTGLGGDRYYGYHADLLEIVNGNFARFGLDPAQRAVEFVQGLVQDTVQGDDPVALAHLDLDWYEPVTVCLERLWPRLSVGGSIIVDDYHDWGGCRRAVDRFLGLVDGYFADDAAGSLKITRVAA